MPKIKTNRGAAKRFKLTASGKIKRRKSGLRHILTKKSSKRKMGLRHSTFVDTSQVKAVKRMLGMA